MNIYTNAEKMWREGLQEVSHDKNSDLYTEFVSIQTRLAEELYMHYAMSSDTDDVFGVMRENIRGFEWLTHWEKDMFLRMPNTGDMTFAVIVSLIAVILTLFALIKKEKERIQNE